MNINTKSHACVVYGYSQEFKVNVEVHRGSVLSHLLLIIVMEALYVCYGAPWEDIYADHLVIISESLEEHVRRLLI